MNRMLKWLAVLSLVVAVPVVAQTAATWNREVLVDTTVTQIDRVKTSGTIRLTNLGPNAIWCGWGKEANAVVNKSERIGPVGERPNNILILTLPASVDVWCIGTVLQVTGAATVVGETPSK